MPLRKHVNILIKERRDLKTSIKERKHVKYLNSIGVAMKFANITLGALQ